MTYEMIEATKSEVEENMPDTVFFVEDIQSENIYEINVDGEFAGFVAYQPTWINPSTYIIFVECVELKDNFCGRGIYRKICAELVNEWEADGIGGDNGGIKGDPQTITVNGYTTKAYIR